MPEILQEFEKDPNEQLDFTIHWGAPDWAQATDYDEFSYVYDPLDGNLYQAQYSHTSTASGSRSTDGSAWKLIKNTKLWLKKYAGVTADEVITSPATWTVPAGITSASEVVDPNGYFVTIWLSGGTAGESYVITVQVTTDNSPTARIGERSIQMNVIDK